MSVSNVPFPAYSAVNMVLSDTNPHNVTTGQPETIGKYLRIYIIVLTQAAWFRLDGVDAAAGVDIYIPPNVALDMLIESTKISVRADVSGTVLKGWVQGFV